MSTDRPVIQPRRSDGEGSRRLVRSVRIDESRLGAILDDLDTSSERDICNRRAYKRYSYRARTCILQVRQPGASSTISYLVPTRNISEDGLAFLHSGFMHIGTKCRLRLATLYGVWLDIKARVVRCRLVEGNLHEVGLQFDEQINLAGIVAEARSYRALLIDDDQMAARLATHHLARLNTQVDLAETGEKGIRAALMESYDFVLLDIDLPDIDGLEVVRQLRRKGYSRFLIAVTSLTDPEDRNQCIAAGCDDYLAKPVNRDDLVALLDRIYIEPLLSSFHHDTGMRELIESFIRELPRTLRDMGVAVRNRDWIQLATLSRQIRANGNGYGYGDIGAVAAQIEIQLRTGPSEEEAMILLRQLLQLCARGAERADERAHLTQRLAIERSATGVLPPRACDASRFLV